MGDKSDDKSPKKQQQQKSQQQRTGKGLICEVVLLDGEHVNIELDRNAEGRDLFEKVCQHLDLIEKDYFGIQFIDERISNRLKCWLSPDKKITKQKKGAPWLFDFALKFYPPDPTQLRESLTRWLVVLQTRRDILSGKLPTTFLTQAMLGSYCVQADVGDFDPNEHRGIEYIRDTCFAPNQTADLLEKIVELHKQHKGQTPDEAEINFLENAKKLSMYGVDLHAAQDANNVDIMLGVCASGLQVYREKLRISRFVWPKILKICYKRRHFYVKVRPTDAVPTDNTVSFKLASHRLAKRLWKICVEHHAFFRLREAEQSQNAAMFPRLGSKFRYSGRTLYQTRQSSQILERPDPYFERSQPARNTFAGANTKSHSMDELSNRPDYWKDDEEYKNRPGGKDETDKKNLKDDPYATATKAGVEDSTALGSGEGALAPGADKSMDGKDRQDRKPGEDDSTLNREGAEGTLGLTAAELQKKAKEDEKERKKREKEEEKRRKKEEEERKKAEKAAKKGKGKGDTSAEDRKDVTAGGDPTLQAQGRTPGSHGDQEGKRIKDRRGQGLVQDGNRKTSEKDEDDPYTPNMQKGTGTNRPGRDTAGPGRNMDRQRWSPDQNRDDDCRLDDGGSEKDKDGGRLRGRDGDWYIPRGRGDKGGRGIVGREGGGGERDGLTPDRDGWGDRNRDGRGDRDRHGLGDGDRDGWGRGQDGHGKGGGGHRDRDQSGQGFGKESEDRVAVLTGKDDAQWQPAGIFLGTGRIEEGPLSMEASRDSSDGGKAGKTGSKMDTDGRSSDKGKKTSKRDTKKNKKKGRDADKHKKNKEKDGRGKDGNTDKYGKNDKEKKKKKGKVADKWDKAGDKARAAGKHDMDDSDRGKITDDTDNDEDSDQDKDDNKCWKFGKGRKGGKHKKGKDGRMDEDSTGESRKGKGLDAERYGKDGTDVKEKGKAVDSRGKDGKDTDWIGGSHSEEDEDRHKGKDKDGVKLWKFGRGKEGKDRDVESHGKGDGGVHEIGKVNITDTASHEDKDKGKGKDHDTHWKFGKGKKGKVADTHGKDEKGNNRDSDADREDDKDRDKGKEAERYMKEGKDRSKDKPDSKQDKGERGDLAKGRDSNDDGYGDENKAREKGKDGDKYWPFDEDRKGKSKAVDSPKHARDNVGRGDKGKDSTSDIDSSNEIKAKGTGRGSGKHGKRIRDKKQRSKLADTHGKDEKGDSDTDSSDQDKDSGGSKDADKCWKFGKGRKGKGKLADRHHGDKHVKGKGNVADTDGDGDEDRVEGKEKDIGKLHLDSRGKSQIADTHARSGLGQNKGGKDLESDSESDDIEDRAERKAKVGKKHGKDVKEKKGKGKVSKTHDSHDVGKLEIEGDKDVCTHDHPDEENRKGKAKDDDKFWKSGKDKKGKGNLDTTHSKGKDGKDGDTDTDDNVDKKRDKNAEIHEKFGREKKSKSKADHKTETGKHRDTDTDSEDGGKARAKRKEDAKKQNDGKDKELKGRAKDTLDVSAIEKGKDQNIGSDSDAEDRHSREGEDGGKFWKFGRDRKGKSKVTGAHSKDELDKSEDGKEKDDRTHREQDDKHAEKGKGQHAHSEGYEDRDHKARSKDGKKEGKDEDHMYKKHKDRDTDKHGKGEKKGGLFSKFKKTKDSKSRLSTQDDAHHPGHRGREQEQRTGPGGYGDDVDGGAGDKQGSAYPYLGPGLLVDGGDMSGVVGEETWIDNKIQFEPIEPPKKETKQSLKSGLHGIDHTMPFFSPDATSTVGRPGKVPPKPNSYDDSFDRTDVYKNNKDGIQETRVQHKMVLSSADDEDFDYDAALADAIRSVTEFNPDMSVERIECVQQIEDANK